ncbi:MAG TPA: hypothetical protein VKU80_05125, partial [Planctomycetota bacterium]|nr:hypothetical protein [Planctomycetota bacterium]
MPASGSRLVRRRARATAPRDGGSGASPRIRRTLPWAAAGVLVAAFLGCDHPSEPPPVPPAPPPQKATSRTILFNTPEADAILSGLQIFPKDNPWNEDVSQRPLHPDSARIIETIGRDLRFRWNRDMPFILVPPDQPKRALEIGARDESEPGPYPIPDNAPLEGWPLSGVPLEKLQREGEGDRHLIVLDPASMKLYELFSAFRTAKGWKA